MRSGLWTNFTAENGRVTQAPPTPSLCARETTWQYRLFIFYTFDFRFRYLL